MIEIEKACAESSKHAGVRAALVLGMRQWLIDRGNSRIDTKDPISYWLPNFLPDETPPSITLTLEPALPPTAAAFASATGVGTMSPLAFWQTHWPHSIPM